MQARNEIKDIQRQIKDSICFNKLKWQEEKEKNCKDIYDMKSKGIKAKYNREKRICKSNVEQYSLRINSTERDTQNVHEMMKRLEQEEMAMI